MGVSFFECFNCNFIGSEACFEKNTGDIVPDVHYCDDCVEELFQVAPVHYWVHQDDKIEEVTTVAEGQRWSVTYADDVPNGEGSVSEFHNYVNYEPKSDGSWKKRTLEKIEERMESLKKFKEFVESDSATK